MRPTETEKFEKMEKPKPWTPKVALRTSGVLFACKVFKDGNLINVLGLSFIASAVRFFSLRLEAFEVERSGLAMVSTPAGSVVQYGSIAVVSRCTGTSVFLVAGRLPKATMGEVMSRGSRTNKLIQIMINPAKRKHTMEVRTCNKVTGRKSS